MQTKKNSGDENNKNEGRQLPAAQHIALGPLELVGLFFSFGFHASAHVKWNRTLYALFEDADVWQPLREGSAIAFNGLHAKLLHRRRKRAVRPMHDVAVV